MRIRNLILLVVLAQPVQAAAPTTLLLSGSTVFQRNRVQRLVHTLNYTHVAMIDPWTINILSTDDWNKALATYKNATTNNLNTNSAFSFVSFGTTDLSEDYLLQASDDSVRHTLAHESGHFICECTSEKKANDIAFALEK